MSTSGFQISLSHCENWQVSDAVREIVSNMHDAISQVTLNPVQFKYLKMETDRVRISAYVLDGQSKQSFGHIDWDMATGVLAVFNAGLSITAGNISNIGFSKKRSESNTVGQFGEGLKSALGPLVKKGCTITFTTPTLSTRFTSRVNPDEPTDHLLVAEPVPISEIELPIDKLQFGYDKSDGKLPKWTLVKITGIKDRNQLGLDNFLFLQPAKVIKNHLSLKGGMLLLDGSQKGRIYVQRIFVCHRSDLPFGLALGPTVLMTRDRGMLSGTTTKLLLSAIPASPDPALVDFLYKELNRKEPEPFYRSLAKEMPGTLITKLFSHGLDATASFYTCKPRHLLSAEEDFLLALQDPDKLRSVYELLFRTMWIQQESELKSHRSTIMTKLGSSTVSVRSPTENEKLKEVQNFLNCLLPDEAVTVSIVDSTSIYSARLKRVAIIERLPCVWIQEKSTLLLDLKLLNNRNVHNRIKAEMEREHDKDQLKWKPTECENRFCACLQSTILTQVQKQHGLSTSYCTKVIANYAKTRNAAIVAERSPCENDISDNVLTDSDCEPESAPLKTGVAQILKSSSSAPVESSSSALALGTDNEHTLVQDLRNKIAAMEASALFEDKNDYHMRALENLGESIVILETQLASQSIPIPDLTETVSYSDSDNDYCPARHQAPSASSTPVPVLDIATLLKFDDGQLREFGKQIQDECYRRWIVNHESMDNLTRVMQGKVIASEEKLRAESETVESLRLSLLESRLSLSESEKQRIRAEEGVTKLKMCLQEDLEHSRLLEEHIQKKRKRFEEM